MLRFTGKSELSGGAGVLEYWVAAHRTAHWCATIDTLHWQPTVCLALRMHMPGTGSPAAAPGGSTVYMYTHGTDRGLATVPHSQPEP